MPNWPCNDQVADGNAGVSAARSANGSAFDDPLDAFDTTFSFSRQEEALYQNLFHAADIGGTGGVGTEAGAELLQRSGLPRHVLAKIWERTDTGKNGVLNRDQFFLALRLVAHAQSGRDFSPELSGTEPANLPTFDEGQEAAAVTQPAASIRDTSPCAPSEATTIGWQTEVSLSTVASGISRPPSWEPSVRERRKYASLFLRTDTDKNGFIGENEARTLGKRSGLDEDALASAWFYADQDQDGHLTFPEFIIFVHMITCGTRGMSLPHPNEGHRALPPPLLDVRSSTERPEELHSQRSRPTSRAASQRSSSPSEPASPFKTSNQLTEACAVSGAMEHKTAFDTRSWETGSLHRPRVDIDTSEQGLKPIDQVWMFPDVDQDPAPDASPSRFGDVKNQSRVVTSDFALPGPKTDLSSEEQKVVDTAAACQHLKGVWEADQILNHQAKVQADSVQERLRSATAARDKMRQLLVRENEECRQIRRMSNQLERTVADAKARLSGLLERRRGLRRGHLAGSKGDGLTFLQKTFEDETQALEELKLSNNSLSESVAVRAREAEDMNFLRADVLHSIDLESKLLQKDREYNQANLPGDRSGGGAGAFDAVLQDHTRHSVASDTPASIREDGLSSGPFAWSSTLVGQPHGGMNKNPLWNIGPGPGTRDAYSGRNPHSRLGV